MIAFQVKKKRQIIKILRPRMLYRNISLTTNYFLELPAQCLTSEETSTSQLSMCSREQAFPMSSISRPGNPRSDTRGEVTPSTVPFIQEAESPSF